MTGQQPLLTTQIGFVRSALIEFVKPGEPADGAVIAYLDEQLRLIADMAALADRELSLHRQLMDETHARKIAAALGARNETETMQ